MFRTNIFYIFFAFCLLIAGFFSFKLISSYKNRPDLEQKNNLLKDKDEYGEQLDPRSYNDKNVSFDIPEGLILNKDNNELKLVKDVLNIGSGPTNFIYIRTLDKDEETNAKDFISFLEEIKSNGSASYGTDGDEEKNELSGTYVRSGDKEISGFPGRTFTRQDPLGYPKGTFEIIYLIKGSEDFHLVGAFLGPDTRDNYYISREVFELFISELMIN
jgi:hypothetical protein